LENETPHGKPPKMGSAMKLTNKILIPSLSIMIITLMVISIISAELVRNTARDLTNSKMQNIAESVNSQIALTDEVVSIALNMMDQKNISFAQTLAFIIDENPEMLEHDNMVMLAKLFGVDEVHVTDGDGVLQWGNIPGFYGFNFKDGEQTRPLLAILGDPGLAIAQEPQPRGVDGVMFQYISVSRRGMPGIVQVGVSMDRIEDIKSSMSIQSAIEGMKIGIDGGVILINRDKKVAASSTRSMLGSDLGGQSWVDEMFKGDGGNMTYTYNSISYDSYYRKAGNDLLVLYLPSSEIQDYTTRNLRAITFVSFAAVLMQLLLIFFLFRKFITRPIKALVRASEDMAVGNMDIGLTSNANDEFGQLTSSFKKMQVSTLNGIQILEQIAEGDLTPEIPLRGDKDSMGFAMIKIVDSLNHLFGEINNATVEVSTGAKQVADGARLLAKGSNDQTELIRELSSSIVEMAEQTKANADKARETANLAKAIMGKAEKGNVQMDDMMKAVEDINESSRNINKIIKTIDDIAFQTNILALNAAVEAARAGNAGKGFAVVAEEVRNLATKSAEAAKNTGNLIADSIVKAELGASIAGETATSLREIVAGINGSNRLIGEIAKSSEEQSEAISRVNTGIEQVAQAVNDNNSTVRESADTSERLSGQSNILQKMMTKFKLKSDAAVRGIPSKAAPAGRLALRGADAAYTDGGLSFGKY